MDTIYIFYNVLISIDKLGLGCAYKISKSKFAKTITIFDTNNCGLGGASGVSAGLVR